MDGNKAGGDGRVSPVRRVVVLEPLGRSGEIVAALRSAGFEVSVAETIARMARRGTGEEPFVAIVDDHQPHWVRDVSDLVTLRPLARPLVLAVAQRPEEILSALSAGVAGFVPPSADTDAIVRSVRSIFDVGVAIPRSMVPALVAAIRHGRGHSVETASGRIDLTDREWSILQLLLQRRSTREIADVLYVSVGTVRSHVSALLRKLGAEDREDLIRLIEHPHRRSAS